jgi:hypothetical protein
LRDGAPLVVRLSIRTGVMQRARAGAGGGSAWMTIRPDRLGVSLACRRPIDRLLDARSTVVHSRNRRNEPTRMRNESIVRPTIEHCVLRLPSISTKRTHRSCAEARGIKIGGTNPPSAWRERTGLIITERTHNYDDCVNYEACPLGGSSRDSRRNRRNEPRWCEMVMILDDTIDGPSTVRGVR